MSSGRGVRGSHHKNRQTDRGEGCERKCAERRDEKSGAKTHEREHINNNNNTTKNEGNNTRQKDKTTSTSFKSHDTKRKDH